MQGDFTRDTFRRANHFSRVLTQQGRVHLDAEDNEQTSILLHYLRTLATDLIGPHGGPAGCLGFKITPTSDPNGHLTDLALSSGRYYVDGILCENEKLDMAGNPLTVTYYHQPDTFWDRTRDPLPDQFSFLVYLDVWERHLTAIGVPEIREVALGPNGPDAASRAKVVWHVRTTAKLAAGETPVPNDPAGNETKWQALKDRWQPSARGMLKAGTGMVKEEEQDACIVSPESRYRGAENQLYRVEIHTGGTAAQGATFKWSRENASVVFAIETIAGSVVTVQDLGRNSRLGLSVGDWVEIVDDDSEVRLEPVPLFRVTDIVPADRQVTLHAAPTAPTGHEAARHPLLRRWDHKEGDPKRGGQSLAADCALPIVEGATADHAWLALEDGIQIQFQTTGATYRRGDFWLIPARTATGDVEWPGAPHSPIQLPPHGVEHHYAPLALVRGPNDVEDLRCWFNRLACPPGT